MTFMNWIYAHPNKWRLALLLLLLISFLGPWGYTYDGVPPAEYCDERFVLTENGRCAATMRGFAMLPFSFVAPFIMASALISDNITLGQALGSLTLTLIWVPLLSTLLQQSGRGAASRRQRILHLLALIAPLAMMIFWWPVTQRTSVWPLWGYQLYVTALGSLILLELLTAWPRLPAPRPTTA